MPTCPGCQQRVSYERLDAHERYCPRLGGSDDAERRTIEHLEERVDDLERRVEGRLRLLEGHSGRHSAPDGDDEGTRKLLEGNW